MVNLDESSSTSSSSQATPGFQNRSIHFDLSKPLALKPFSNVFKLESDKKWSPGKTTTTEINFENSNQSIIYVGFFGPRKGLFEFLEPYEPAHLRDRSINGPSSGGGKILSSHSLRNGSNKSRPYELSRSAPVANNNNKAISNGHVDSQLAALESTAATTATHQQSALLARLTSLSSTFKSIFVRPKSARLVSYEKFTSSTSTSSGPGASNSSSGQIERRETANSTEFKLRLFSTNESIPIGNDL